MATVGDLIEVGGMPDQVDKVPGTSVAASGPRSGDYGYENQCERD